MSITLEPAADAADAPFDPGRQAERTSLAWRRTSLTLAAGALVAMRILPHYWGSWGLITAGAGILAAAAILAMAVRRYQSHRRGLTGQPAVSDLPGSAPLALLAAAGMAAGICALLLVITA